MALKQDGAHFVLCPKQCNKTECVVLKTSKQGVTCIKGFFSRGWGGRNWHHFENQEATGKRRDPWNDKDHVTGISHGQKVTNVMAWQDLWVFTCWAEFCRFLECKEIATGHDKKTGSHLFLLFRKVISLFHHFVISRLFHFAISCFKHALAMQWFPPPPPPQTACCKTITTDSKRTMWKYTKWKLGDHNMKHWFCCFSWLA